MRSSAVIGSEKMTRSTRRVTGEIHQVVDGAELWHAGCARGAALVVAVVEHADQPHVGIALRAERADQLFAVAVAADDHGAAVEPALVRPAAHHEKQSAPEGDQREQAEHVKRAEPGAGELVAGLGEKRNADGDQEHHGPRRSEPHVLLLVAAEGLDLIDIGDLERQHGEKRDAGDGGEVIPGEAVASAPRSRHKPQGRRRRRGRLRSRARGRRARSAKRRALAGYWPAPARRAKAQAEFPARRRRAAWPALPRGPLQRCRKSCWVRAWTWRPHFRCPQRGRGKARRQSERQDSK